MSGSLFGLEGVVVVVVGRSRVVVTMVVAAAGVVVVAVVITVSKGVNVSVRTFIVVVVLCRVSMTGSHR